MCPIIICMGIRIPLTNKNNVGKYFTWCIAKLISLDENIHRYANNCLATQLPTNLRSFRYDIFSIFVSFFFFFNYNPLLCVSNRLLRILMDQIPDKKTTCNCRACSWFCIPLVFGFVLFFFVRSQWEIELTPPLHTVFLMSGISSPCTSGQIFQLHATNEKVLPANVGADSDFFFLLFCRQNPSSWPMNGICCRGSPISFLHFFFFFVFCHSQ